MGLECGFFFFSYGMLSMLPLQFPCFPSFQSIAFKIFYYYMQSAKESIRIVVGL